MIELPPIQNLQQALISLWREQLRWLIPTDPRGIVLGCGFIGVAAIGMVFLLNGDPLAYGFLCGAIAGGLFLQTRLMTTFLWLVFAASGVWAVASGGPAGWVVVTLGLGLGAVAMLPVADLAGYPPAGSVPQIVQPSLNPTSALAEVSCLPDSQTGLVIKTLGRLQILTGRQDLAPALLDRRILGFLWCWLLAVAIRTPDGGVGRADMAAELAPGPNRRSQLERLRRQLWDLQHDLPVPLGAMVSVERNRVRLELSGVDCDLINLRSLVAEIQRKDREPGPELIAEARAMAESGLSGRFLPEFEELARSARQSRGAGVQAVTDVRTWALEARMNLSSLVGRLSFQPVSEKESSK